MGSRRPLREQAGPHLAQSAPHAGCGAGRLSGTHGEARKAARNVAQSCLRQRVLAGAWPALFVDRQAEDSTDALKQRTDGRAPRMASQLEAGQPTLPPGPASMPAVRPKKRDIACKLHRSAPCAAWMPFGTAKHFGRPRQRGQQLHEPSSHAPTRHYLAQAARRLHRASLAASIHSTRARTQPPCHAFASQPRCWCSWPSRLHTQEACSRPCWPAPSTQRRPTSTSARSPARAVRAALRAAWEGLRVAWEACSHAHMRTPRPGRAACVLHACMHAAAASHRVSNAHTPARMHVHATT